MWKSLKKAFKAVKDFFIPAKIEIIDKATIDALFPGKSDYPSRLEIEKQNKENLEILQKENLELKSKIREKETIERKKQVDEIIEQKAPSPTIFSYSQKHRQSYSKTFQNVFIAADFENKLEPLNYPFPWFLQGGHYYVMRVFNYRFNKWQYKGRSDNVIYNNIDTDEDKTMIINVLKDFMHKVLYADRYGRLFGLIGVATEYDDDDETVDGLGQVELIKTALEIDP